MLIRSEYPALKIGAFFMASSISVLFGTINEPAAAAETANLLLPIMLSADDATVQSKATVQPMSHESVDILGPRQVSFQSTANVFSEVRVGKKGREVSIAPTDRLVEYEIRSGRQSFPAYCKTYPQKPVSGLICLADRDGNADFDQVWLGEVANPPLLVPFPLIRLQNFSFTPQRYSIQTGPISSDLKFGFSVTGAGGLANKRELYLQISNGSQKVYMFYNRITGPSRSGPVDTSIFDSQIRLYGEDSKTVTYSIEKPLMQQRYSIVHPGISRNVWIYVPG